MFYYTEFHKNPIYKSNEPSLPHTKASRTEGLISTSISLLTRRNPGISSLDLAHIGALHQSKKLHAPTSWRCGQLKIFFLGSSSSMKSLSPRETHMYKHSSPSLFLKSFWQSLKERINLEWNGGKCIVIWIINDQNGKKSVWSKLPLL